ncbi:MAG: TldD/PmbA family protein [Proteobacteria bacterium]|nr:TldD/PmbA family protein [Pseudomonadota bacterium]
MLTDSAALDRAEALVKLARRAGADSADAVYSADASQSVAVRLGRLEDVGRTENERIGLRVFVGQRSASIGSTDLSDAALEELASRAVAMARLAPEDRFAGLAPEELLARSWPTDLDLSDPVEPDPEALRQTALAAEDAARAVAGVTNSEGAGVGCGQAVAALATSHGFAGAYSATSHSLSASVVAGEGAAMQRDYAWRAARHRADLLDPAEIGRMAGERAVARLNPGRVKSGPMPVVFDPRVGGSLLGHLVGAINGPAVARRASFLIGKEGAQLFAPGIRVVDDPLRRRGLRSRPFDGEGLPTAPRDLIADGRLTGWLLDCASARQLGLAPTGHAARGGSGAPMVSVTNLHLAAGNLGVSDLIADIAEGVYVTELIGQGVSTVTGDYSRGAAGFRIVNGALAGPVAEITIAGTLGEMFARLTPADDLEWHRAINVPTIRIDGMMVAGE